ncbi:MAG: hypothetical protein EBY17_23330 [Acidobacteriia bacterium]|nr:hypothetical protein [Terriglobia bacterium]
MTRPTAKEFAQAFADIGLPGVRVGYHETSTEEPYYETDIPGWLAIAFHDDEFDPQTREIRGSYFRINGDPEYPGRSWTRICHSMRDVATMAYEDLLSDCAGARESLMRARKSLDSTPEKAPVKLGEPVTPALIVWLRGQGLPNSELLPIIAGIEERSAAGLEKYDQVLMSGDGRDSVNDARQELLDFLQYAQAAKMKNRSLAPLESLVNLVLSITK